MGRLKLERGQKMKQNQKIAWTCQTDSILPTASMAVLLTRESYCHEPSQEKEEKEKVEIAHVCVCVGGVC